MELSHMDVNLIPECQKCRKPADYIKYEQKEGRYGKDFLVRYGCHGEEVAEIMRSTKDCPVLDVARVKVF